MYMLVFAFLVVFSLLPVSVWSISNFFDYVLSVLCERSAHASEASEAREAIQTHAHSQRLSPGLCFSLSVSFCFLLVFFLCVTMRMSC